MPNITIEGPVLSDIEKKRKLVNKITEIVSEIYSLPPSAFVVIIKENFPENVGVGGKLIVDLHKK